MKQAEDKFTIDIFDEMHERPAPEVSTAVLKLISERNVGDMDKAKDAFYAWERANNEQDLSDRDRWLWTAGWIQAQTDIADEDPKYIAWLEEMFWRDKPCE
jgi:hypothetical protein